MPDLLTILSRHLAPDLAALAANPDSILSLADCGRVSFALAGLTADLDPDALTPDQRLIASAALDAADVVAARRMQLANAPASLAQRLATPAPPRPPLGVAQGRMATRPTSGSSVGVTTTRALTASGSPISEPADWSAAWESAIRAAKNSPDGTRTIVASIRTEYPEDRRLVGPDTERNSQLLDAACGVEALTASGGITNPVSAVFDIGLFASDETPLADGLPDFQATRGGIRYLLPATLASVGAAGTVVWTQANDIALNSPNTKPTFTVTASAEQEVLVEAVPTRLILGALSSRFYPELAANVTATCLAAAARVRENRLLTLISAGSTAVSSAQLLGASRDLLGLLDQAVAAARWRNRIPDSVQYRAVLPRWIRNMIRADLTRALAHGDDNSTLALSDADVNALLAVRGVTPIWHDDGLGSATVSGIPVAAQQFAAPSAGAALTDWPRTLRWWLFPESTWIRLDGGTLDIGVVRDSTLNATNDFETFIEVFQGLAFRGVESLEIISALRPNGATASGVSTTAY